MYFVASMEHLVHSTLHLCGRIQLKETVSWDRLLKFQQKFTGLTKGRGWFLNFLGAPMILKCKKSRFIAVNAIVCWRNNG